ncbi:hypothetical protein GE21DRAFT_1120636 [Neurospora crassa]|nr:hypothetical protein GE21DRAFT_1120636 [Neurospora crassa]
MTTGKSAKRWLGSQRKSGFSPFPCFFGSPPSLGVWSPRQAYTAVTRFTLATCGRIAGQQCNEGSVPALSSFVVVGSLFLSFSPRPSVTVPTKMIHKSCFQLPNNSGQISGVCLLSRVPCSSLHRNMGQ